MNYENMSFSELKDLVDERELEVGGDARSKKSLIAALEYADAISETKATLDEAQEAASPVESELEKKLAKLVPGPDTRIVFGRDYTRTTNPVNDDMQVRNLPANYTHAWPNMVLNQGEDMGRYLGLGWIRVTTDMVTSDPNRTDKIYVRNYEDYNGYVKYNDTTLVIADRRLVEPRKSDYLENWNRKVEKTYGKRGELTRDRVGDPSESSQRSYKRTSQWKAEVESNPEGGN